MGLNTMKFSRAWAKVRHGVQSAANATAAAGIAAGVAGGAVAARGLYERARPALMHSKPGFVRGADAALATYDAVRGAIGR